ncbi:carbohydrate ABC transporter permease [Aeromicrobium sp. 179-A 4D2 NHS]|uniref:carbohydrate ABC transporter permease n=1 Tax=Aeromicrobium sp. 179-A 4D2 NHS TaxID=3142375 RepID=UPI00399EF2AF
MSRTLARRLWGALAVLIALVWVFPVYWILNSAFQPADRLRSPEPAWFPRDLTGSGFARVFDEAFLDSFRLSITVTLIAVVGSALCAFLAAVAISRFRFRGRTQFVLIVLAVQMIPPEALFISQYRMLGDAGLYNTVGGLSLLYVALILPFTIWMLRGFADGVPIELEEAAMVDGCSRTRAFFLITLPLLAPGLIAASVYGFLQAWNEFTLAVVVMDPSNRTLPLWLRGLSDVSNDAIDWPGVMAGASLVAVPVIVFFMIVQGRMTSGLVSGAVKG